MDNNFITIEYFSKSDKIVDLDFQNPNKKTIINKNLILSLSELEKFKPLFANRKQQTNNEYSLLTMVNNDKYYLKEEAYKNIYDCLLNYEPLD